jgi:hypothetical protein
MHCTNLDMKNRTRIHGAHVPVEESSAASEAAETDSQ